MLGRETLIRRIRSEYREMPGLRLTIAQACQLWGVEERVCRTLLEQLVADGFLARPDDGTFVERSTIEELYESVRGEAVP